MWWACEQVMDMDATAASAWDASGIARHAQDVHGIQIYVINHWSMLGVGEERGEDMDGDADVKGFFGWIHIIIS